MRSAVRAISRNLACRGRPVFRRAHGYSPRYGSPDVLATLMGALLLVLGLFHFVYLLPRCAASTCAGGISSGAAAGIIVGGVVLFMPSVRSNVNEVVLVTGISLLLFNITSLQEYFAERRTIKAQLAAFKAQQDAAATAVVTDEPAKPPPPPRKKPRLDHDK